MEALRQYIISVVAAAMICGVIRNLAGKGSQSRVIGLICGLFLTYTVLAPVARLDFTGLTEAALPDLEEAKDVAQTGVQYARDTRAQRIREAAEAYILDKASDFGAQITVRVLLDETQQPTSVVITGALAPKERKQLQSTIALDLGIAKENQQWIPSS